jgi:hypothetical protein
MEAGHARSDRGARRKAVLIATVFVLLGIGSCLEALQVPFGSFRMPGAGFFPLLLGMLLIALALVLLSTSLLGHMPVVPQVWPTRVEVLYLMGAIFMAVWLFERAGYLPTMALFLGVMLRTLGKVGWVATVLLALAGSVTAYVLFGRVLMIGLPAGFLPF